MDIALELMDNYVFDYAYAYLAPSPAFKFRNFAANATAPQALSTWTYKPSSFLFELEPSRYAYMSSLPRDNIFRQYISLFLITWLFGLLTYFMFSSLSYAFIFDKETMKHPKYLKNQVWLEIKQASSAMPVMALLTDRKSVV